MLFRIGAQVLSKIGIRRFVYGAFSTPALKTRNLALRPFNTEEAMGHLLYVDLLIVVKIC
jgi:hypothetical protein